VNRASPFKPELWVALVEQAMVKRATGESSVERAWRGANDFDGPVGLHPQNAQIMLLGNGGSESTKSFEEHLFGVGFHGKKENYKWMMKIRNMLTNGGVVTAATGLDIAQLGGQTVDPNTNLYRSHMYTVLRTYQSKGMYYVVLRNPHGNSGGNYNSKGAYSTRVSGGDDATFRMRMKDFRQQFEMVASGKLRS
jgi:hypothetical protein